MPDNIRKRQALRGMHVLLSLAAVITMLVSTGFLVAPVSADGPPQVPAFFSGTVTVNGSAASVGTSIEAKINSVSCGTYTVATAGSYGPILVQNGNNGDTVQFYVNSVAAQTGIYQSGLPQTVNLSTGSGSPPAAPVLSSPADGATGVSTTPTLQWSASTGATSYAVQVSTSSSFSPVIFTQSGITDVQVTVSTALSTSTVYYWRANATNASGTSAWSSYRSFTTQATAAPSAPVLSSPANGATGVATTPTLVWNASTGATSYGVQVSTSSSFSPVVFTQSGITSTQVTVSTVLSSSTLYYWRANATNASGTSSWSSYYSFTTASGGGGVPTIPAFFRGTAYKDGTAVNQKQVCVTVNSVSACTTTDTSGNYLVMANGNEGSSATFTVDSAAATETATFHPGWVIRQDLHANTGGPLTVVTTSLPAATVGSAYSSTPEMRASGGVLPYTWSLATGSLPAWATYNPSTGLITGTPSSPGTSAAFVFRVTDSSTPTPQTALSPSLTITAQAPGSLSVVTTSLPNGTISTAYSSSPEMRATGGTAPYTWAVTSGSLPTWAALNASTGLITGTPDATGTSAAFVITVTDSSTPTPQTAVSPSLTITVGSTPTPPTCGTDPLGCVAAPYTGRTGGNTAVFCRFAATSSTTVSKIKLVAYGADNAKVAIYSDVGMSPSARLAVNNTLTPITLGENTITLASPLAITSGTYYWLACWTQYPTFYLSSDSGLWVFTDTSSTYDFPATVTGTTIGAGNRGQISAIP